jgi:hypothetical protein
MSVALSRLLPTWQACVALTRAAHRIPGAAVCDLTWCRHSCGSAQGGRPHGIHLDLLWP